MSRDSRPVFLNLLKIRLPVQGITSIAHRISGVLLFLAIPMVLWLLMNASSGDAGYERARDFLNAPVAMPLVLLIAWAFWHHLFAGIRFLLIDLELGIDKETSRITALTSLLLAVIAALLTALAWYL